MNYSTYRRTLDLQKHQSNLSIAVFQYDSAVRLILSFTDGGKPYLIKEGSQAVFYGKRPDDTPLCLPCIISNDSEIVFEFNDTVTAVLGMVNCQIRLYGKITVNAGGETVRELITAPRFTILVEQRVVDSDDVEITDSTLEALDQIFLDEVERWNNEKQRDDNEKIREANELQRIANEEARQNSIEGFASTTTEERQTFKGDLEVPKLIVTDSVTCDKVNAYNVNAMGTLYSEESIQTDGELKGASANISGRVTTATLESDEVATGNIVATGNATIYKEAKVYGTVDADKVIARSAEISGNLIVKGITETQNHKNLAVQDNLIITNSSGTSFSSSGLAILTPSGACYGILYLPNGESGEAVYIGQGRINPETNEFEFGTYKDGEFIPNDDEAVPLAARSGAFNEGDIPLWDAEKNAFKSSGIGLDEVCITEYDYEITEPSQFTTDNLATMRGNILVSCDIEATDDDMSVTIPIGVNLINFNGHYLNYSLYAESLYAGYPTCRLISANIGMGVNSYEVTMSNFASVEFCTGNGCFANCNRIAHSSIWNAVSCSFITDVVTSTPESQMATFYNCSNITNVKVEDVSDGSSMGVEFDSCSNISNITKYGSADGVITYTNCKYVDALTCVGYGVGVPYVDSNGTVSFLESAEGGSYGT